MSLKTIIYFILDCSGSMAGKEKDVIGGVNTFIDQQKKLDLPGSIAMVRFDNEIEVFRPMTPISEVKHLTPEEYVPRASTALLDAVGQTIMSAEKDWITEKADRCIVVVQTDGQENASKEYTKAKVKELIDAREASERWVFTFMGANVDSFAEAGQMGFKMVNTANFTATSAGMAGAYENMSASIGTLRGASVKAFAAGANMGGDIQDDGTIIKKPITGTTTTVDTK